MMKRELWPRAPLGRMLALLSSVLVGCGGGTELVAPPPPPPVASLTLAVTPDPEDAAVAAALGWAGIPGAEVQLQAIGGGAVKTFTTTPQGSVALSGVLSGDYAIEATRWLTSTERSAVSPANSIVGFVARTTVRIPTAGSVEVLVPASRRNGLMISEWAHAVISSPSTGNYEFGGFLEIANNADTTLYLDGLLLGEAWTQGVDWPDPSCATVASVTNDPSGLWVRRLARFPGSGRQYPLAPGGFAVVATDAIDHRSLTPGGLDLSGANFEVIGPQDVDNPAVPNLDDVGLFSSFSGHGLSFSTLWSVPFLAKKLDPASLARQRPAFFTNGAELLKIPTEAVLDAVVLLATYEFPIALCPQLVNSAIDRRTARLITEANAVTDTILSVHRRRPAGQTFLQDTRTSAADFVLGPRTPGREP